jgi:hypothetical protein
VATDSDQGVDDNGSAHISVRVDNADSGSLTSTIHGVLQIKASELAEIAQMLANRSLPSQINPTTHVWAPQINDFCVKSIAIAGRFDPTGLPGHNFHATVLLYMNKGNYSFEAMNTDQNSKQDSSAESSPIRVADLPETDSGVL